ncbi:MAG: transcriptional regulator with XRE-family HTH domain [Myxococcota bacterium]|jgi:transcriptional regulator with XRE-family HTH domain
MSAAENLARNLRSLRESRGWTQSRLSVVAEVPRATLTNLESGGANPTLSVLVRVAGALGVSIEELIGPPRDIGRHYPREALVRRRKQGAEISEVLPDRLPGLTVERIALTPGGAMAGSPHTAGTREYLWCERGRIELSASGRAWTLAPGEVVVFRGDQRHGYRNVGDQEAVGLSVILVPPSGV